MRKFLLVAVGFIIVLGGLSDSLAQDPATFSIDSQQKARKILEASIRTFGGIEAVRRARNFSMKNRGISYNHFQDETPKTTGFEGWKLERTIVYQSDKNRLYHDRKVTDANSTYVWQARQVIRNGEGFDIIVGENWAMKMRDPSLEQYRDILQLLPQNIISDAWERTAALRSLGEATVELKKQDVVFTRLSTGQMLNLFFDAETHLLTKVDSLFTSNVQGDTITEIYFRGYRKLEGTMIPASRFGYQNKIPRYENVYADVKLDPQVDDRLFELSPDLIKLDIAEAKASVIKMGDGVYLLRSLAGGFNVMFVEFKDFVLAVEPVEENVVNGISAETVATIKKTIPNKPIKYIVPTHHHGDHSAGVRAFLAEGATIITTKGNVDYFDRVAKAKFTFAPDLYAKNPIPYQVKIVENNKMVISDETQTVEIHQFAPLTHVTEMLLIYLPKQKILYQSDMFNPIDVAAKGIPEDDPWHGINPVNTVNLLETLQKLGLNVERIAGSHGRIATMQEFVRASETIRAGKERLGKQ
jgi:glyoxylase-like metal-dependent hydrolase (beta-lactamase superfamily II)